MLGTFALGVVLTGGTLTGWSWLRRVECLVQLCSPWGVGWERAARGVAGAGGTLLGPEGTDRCAHRCALPELGGVEG